MFMLPTDEALGLIDGSNKMNHSILVSRILVVLAKHLGENVDKWELAGLLHDLDYDETIEDRTRHGIIAAQKLDGRVSESILHAIRSHDHRTGVVPTTLLDKSLRFADAMSKLVEKPEALDGKPWIRALIDDYELPEGLTVDDLVKQVSC